MTTPLQPDIQERITTAIGRAKDLPRVQERLDSEEKLGIFGNNFYMLFLALKSRNDGGTKVSHYLKRAEALGEPWQRFVEQNTDLLAEINAALHDWEIHQALLELHRDLCRVGATDDDIDNLENAIHPTLGFDAIYIPVLRRLNPLLERALRKLNDLGITVEDLYHINY